MSRTINELRELLFDTLDDLRHKDPEKRMDVDRARVISQVAGTVIDSARVEIEYLRATGTDAGTGFIPAPTQQEGAAGAPRLANGIQGVTRHLIK